MPHNTGSVVVDEVAKMNIRGNVIPQTWYKTITRPSGKPYLAAIVILSDVVYWYRPAEVRDEATGAVIGYKKRFGADLLQRSYGQLSEQFGISKKEATTAVAYLEQMGVLKRHFRTIVAGCTRMNNVLFIELVPKRLAEITFCDTYTRKKVEPIPPKGDTLPPEKVIGPPPKGDTNTETTTKTTTLNTHTEKNCGANNAPSVCDFINYLWSLYPKRQGGTKEKVAASKAYKKAIGAGASNEQIEAGVIAYASYCREQGVETRYMKRLSVFIADGLYLDDYKDGRAREEERRQILADKYRNQPDKIPCPECGTQSSNTKVNGIPTKYYCCPNCNVAFIYEAEAKTA